MASFNKASVQEKARCSRNPAAGQGPARPGELFGSGAQDLEEGISLRAGQALAIAAHCSRLVITVPASALMAANGVLHDPRHDAPRLSGLRDNTWAARGRAATLFHEQSVAPPPRTVRSARVTKRGGKCGRFSDVVGGGNSAVDRFPQSITSRTTCAPGMPRSFACSGICLSTSGVRT